MAIVIEKRIRAVDTDPWGAWAAATDAPPYVDTALLQYRVENTTGLSIPAVTDIVDSALISPAIIDIEDVTSNNVIVEDGGAYKVTGDGYFDKLMESINTQLKAQHESGRITGPSFAQAYASLFQAAMTQSIQFALARRAREIATDSASLDLAKKALELDVASATQQTKIDQVEAQLAKVEAETSYIDEQETQLINSVNFNNQIKAIDALGDTYGTFGAGGLTVSADMWATYFGLINDLTGTAAPTSTTVSKVS